MQAEGEYRACAVCGRTILRGELPAEYLDGDGFPALVCALCKQRAEASGWIAATLAGSPARARPGRRPRIRIRDRLDRLSRLAVSRGGEPETASELPADLSQRRQPAQPVAERDRPEPAPEPEPIAPPPESLEVFNGSEPARTVAGLARSLGEPKVSIRERRGGLLVTVAWELSWYQWEVDGTEVREVAKGGELGELSDADRDWNASAVDGGGVRLGGA